MADGREPANEYLDDLERRAATGTARRRRDVSEKLATLHYILTTYADGGPLDEPRELRDIGDGIREFKADFIRLYFYDNPNHPVMPAVRVTNGFDKAKTFTGLHARQHFNFAKLIREEDEKR